MAFDTAYPQILANLAAGNEPVAIIDSNFTPLYNGILSLNTFGNYYVDSGAADAYVVTITARQTASLAAGLAVQFLSAHANTGASTLNVNGTGAKNILNADGSALRFGQIIAGSIYNVMYDGTQYRLLGASTSFLTTATAALTGDVALNNTGLFFDGPSLTFVGTQPGTKYLVNAQATLIDTAGAATFTWKLWDGTTTWASGVVTTSAANARASISATALAVSPASATMKLSVKDGTSTSGSILFNNSGLSKDSIVTAACVG